ncbi:hypothetical protein ACFL27_22415 [candidate division CSSED10-310 bacterium]|uniref:Uncharacterized protein n=1 Tax=candidate division CSSED10-310 bacterium TaxID=2855610 RepID=A0ABV6Z3E8_UNCC1
MEKLQHRLENLEKKLTDFEQDITVLRTLVDQDEPSALNKIRYIIEKALYNLSQKNDISWGKGEPTLENMIGPLIKNQIIPKDVATHIRLSLNVLSRLPLPNTTNSKPRPKHNFVYHE